MKHALLTIQALSDQLANLNSNSDNPWTIENQKLFKKIVLKNFIQAMGFMTQAAIVAEKMNHHPEWSNVYKTIEISLTTHSSGGITELDLALAAEMDKILESCNSS